MKYFIAIILIFRLLTLNAFAASIDYNYKPFKGLIESELERKVNVKNNTFPVAGITSHHLPTAAPLIAEFYLELKKRRPDIKRFIVISPDHFEKCRKNFSYGEDALQTSFGAIYPDNNIIDALKNLGANYDSVCLINEHGVGVQANFIKKLFPDSTLTPIVLSYSAKRNNFNRLQKFLKDNDDIFVVFSMDFSHYQNKNQADRIDKITEKKIQNSESRGIELKNVDSPAALNLALDYAKKFNLKPKILTHKNSFDFDGNKYNTTSYFNIFFEK